MLQVTDEAPKGGRKLVLTKWMLIIFSVVTVMYLGLHAIRTEWILPESFYMNFVLGLGLIGGAFTAGNIFEHQARASVEKEKLIKETEIEKGKMALNAAEENSPINDVRG